MRDSYFGTLRSSPSSQAPPESVVVWLLDQNKSDMCAENVACVTIKLIFFFLEFFSFEGDSYRISFYCSYITRYCN